MTLHHQTWQSIFTTISRIEIAIIHGQSWELAFRLLQLMTAAMWVISHPRPLAVQAPRTVHNMSRGFMLFNFFFGGLMWLFSQNCLSLLLTDLHVNFIFHSIRPIVCRPSISNPGICSSRSGRCITRVTDRIQIRPYAPEGCPFKGGVIQQSIT